ncbi:hypothetical protein [Alteribacter aurantiacus]|uniref:hypothetical protein n=1 Tax=Alteribacter aurantiacus TaxID=254410 RepID=UPI0003F4E48D|nr:hypothetical protein [Alteribacter aurantiacus]
MIFQFTSFEERKPLTEVEREELLYVMDLFHEYATTHYKSYMMKHWEVLKNKYPIFKEMPDQAFPQLTTWMIYCVPAARKNKTIFQAFLERRIPTIQSSLTPYTLFMINEWQYCSPGFFYLGANDSKSNRIYDVDDIFDVETKTVVVYKERFTPPQEGSIVTGMMLPFGDGLYTTTADFLHGLQSMCKPAAIDLISFSNYYLSYSYEQLFKEKYPNLLAIFLKHMKNTIN